MLLVWMVQIEHQGYKQAEVGREVMALMNIV
jgi:hypothetical protein